MRKFNFYNKDYWRENQVLYKVNNLTLEENNVYCLVGCNGLGKSTVLTQMTMDAKDNLSKDSYDLSSELTMQWSFEDETNPSEFDSFYLLGNRFTRFGKTEHDYMMVDLLGAFQSSGESNVYYMSKVIGAVEKCINLIRNKTLYLLIDDLDVGVSIDVLQDANRLFGRLVDYLKANNVTYYIIITANSYELTKGKRCIDIINMKEISFDSYEDYAKYVIKTRKFKDTRDPKSKK